MLTSEEGIAWRESSSTLDTMNSLAATYDHDGQYCKAKVLYKRLLAKQNKKLGKKHPDTLWTVTKLAKTITKI